MGDAPVIGDETVGLGLGTPHGQNLLKLMFL
jgi:hypothetical protein